MTPLILNIILLSILFYLIGSIPTAYLLVRSKNIDITQTGSGNVGALNSFEVTGSKKIGVFVLVIDFLKGFIPSFILTRYLEAPLSISVLPILMLIVGHNFSVWLKFKGGRGLATAAGISIAINFWLLIIWCVLFLLVFLVKRNVHAGNIAATVLMPLVLIFTSGFVVKFTYDFYSGADIYNFNWLFTLFASISILILIKHIGPLVELLKTKNIKKLQ